MCGVNGIFSYHHAAPGVDRDEVIATRDAMTARGPDGAGLWVSADQRLALGHRRLKIIDLTNAGSQPMVSPCGRFVLAFNGEIYNYRQLRGDLRSRGEVFRSASDTEVLLKLLMRDGAQGLLQLRGMFALALWDRQRQRLLLARDGFGIKPLYIANDGWQLRFSSQVKALLKGGGVSREKDLAGQAGFLLTGSVPEPFTLYQQIRALPAGHYLMCDADGPGAPVALLAKDQQAGQQWVQAPDREAGDQKARTSVLGNALADSVKAHLVADVPVGVFLSSGIDSAVLAALASQSSSPVRALTVGFSEYRDTPADEVAVAGQVAAALGLKHRIRYYSREEFERDLPTVLEAMDQPSIDGFNTWIVAAACAEMGLKTAISGIGADELFGGYPSFSDVPRWQQRSAFSRWLPGLGVALRKGLQPLCPALGISPKAAGMLEYGSTLGGAYLLKRGLFMPWELASLMGRQQAREGLARLGLLAALERTADGKGSARSKVSRLEQDHYLKNQLLRDADWAGMSHSVEIRVPYVDVRLQAAVGGARYSKADLLSSAQHLLSDSLGEALGQRAKTGFTTPLAQWRGHPGPGWARHWARDLSCGF